MPDTTTLTHNTLGDLFEDIADAIREKNPSAPVEDSMVADTFPTEIRNIPSSEVPANAPLMYWANEGIGYEHPSYPDTIYMRNLRYVPDFFFSNQYVNAGGLTYKTNYAPAEMSPLQITDGTNTIQAIGHGAFFAKWNFEQNFDSGAFNRLKCGLNFINNNSKIEAIGAIAFMVSGVPMDGRKVNIPNDYFPTDLATIDLVLPPNLKDKGLAAQNFTQNRAANGSDVVDNEKYIRYLSGSNANQGSGAFRNNFAIKSVSIPKNVDTISKETFRGCINLENVTFAPVGESSLSKIETGAFEDCQKLTSITIVGVGGTFEIVAGSSLSQFGGAFQNCVNLEEVKLCGMTTAMIGSDTFTGCTALTDIYVPWADGAVSGAPWGAPNSPTIHYNWTPTP